MARQVNPPGLLALTERAVLGTRLRERRSDPPHTRVARPLITISREIGASGTEIAARIAAGLGYHLWDHELLDAMAIRSQTPERLLETVDERKMSRFDETLTDVLLGSRSTQTHYLYELRRLIDTIAREGGSVIVGRGANLLLGGRPALHVRVVAPIDARIARLMGTRRITAKEARRLIHDTDQQHAAFIQRHFDVDVTDPALYDLSVNTASMTLDDAAELVIDSYDRRFGRERATRQAAAEVAAQPTGAR